MLSKLVLLLGASNLTLCGVLLHASTRLALMLGALAPGKKITLAGACNVTLYVTESPMTSVFPLENDLQGGLPGAADRVPWTELMLVLMLTLCDRLAGLFSTLSGVSVLSIDAVFPPLADRYVPLGELSLQQESVLTLSDADPTW